MEKGPWRARMAPQSIIPFMQYCGDRALRANAWEKWTSRASFEHDFYNNSINIEELRHNKLARLCVLLVMTDYSFTFSEVTVQNFHLPSSSSSNPLLPTSLLPPSDSFLSLSLYTLSRVLASIKLTMVWLFVLSIKIPY